MRGCFTVIGIVAAAVILLGVAAFGFLAWRGSGLDAEATTYANDSVVAITSHWDDSELVSRAAPELLAASGDAERQRLFAWLRTLGALRGAPRCAANANVAVDVRTGTRVTAQAACDVDYAAGAAKVLLVLIKRDGAWRIVNFCVDSPALVPGAAPQKI